MFSIIWPWQWRRIARETLAQLQETRKLLTAAEHDVLLLQADYKSVWNQLAETRAKNLQLAQQVKAMSAR